jgi:hypothetical protein
MTVFSVTVLEVALLAGIYQVPALEFAFRRMMASVLAIVVMGAIAYGVGALALLLLERLHAHVRPDAGILWALIGCLLLLVWIKSLLPLPSLVGLNQLVLIGIMMGVFTTGRRYWRRW